MKKINSFKLLAVPFLLTLIVGCKSTPKQDAAAASAPAVIDAKTVAKSDGELSVMTFNVENMLDTIHDKGTEDYTYLPLSKKKKNKEVQAFCKAMTNSYYQKECYEFDWSDAVLKAKLKNVGDVIKFVDGGKGPDNILMAEVENLRVLKMLVKTQLSKLGYKTVVLIEGPDLRGIDPAFISKFPMVGKPKLHIIPYQDSNPEKLKWAKRSRGILEVTVQAPNKKNITFLSAHFPSQSNPTEWRAQAVEFAKNLMLDYQKQGRAVIFGGDLNIITTEEASKAYFKNELSKAGQVSHLVGCKHCLGSHNYRGDWSFLDVLVFSNNLKDVGFELQTDSFQVVRSPYNTKADGTPNRFNPEAKTGAADHFPLYSRVKYF
ncbi:endonuclease/exonuclease/phosphatase family protein [bacterium]|nr:endonuclease/exonuclease/phosphatase family protein [bacterium]